MVMIVDDNELFFVFLVLVEELVPYSILKIPLYIPYLMFIHISPPIHFFSLRRDTNNFPPRMSRDSYTFSG
jgi:hypothetical protein